MIGPGIIGMRSFCSLDGVQLDRDLDKKLVTVSRDLVAVEESPDSPDSPYRLGNRLLRLMGVEKRGQAECP